MHFEWGVDIQTVGLDLLNPGHHGQGNSVGEYEVPPVKSSAVVRESGGERGPVSYTHLTLPTICSV
eukprot:9318075-Alexandrium_andersonii.AAC.1